jgi:hypothetical protein
VASVRLRFADGSTSTLRPTHGYVLQAMAPGHLKPGHEVIAADGFARNGRRVGHESLRPGRPVRSSG